MVSLAFDFVAIIGMVDSTSGFSTPDPGPVFRRTTIDSSVAFPSLDDADIGLAFETVDVAFALDDDGRDCCFVSLVFARLPGLLLGF